MPLALLYDIHGNLPALQTVLQDARAAGAEQFLLGGDYALFGGWPDETVLELHALDNATWIRGNGERWTAYPGEAPDDEVVQGAIRDCNQALGDTVVAQLAALPEATVIDGTRYCHASPLSDVRSFAPQATDDDEELLAGAQERRIVFGHTHLPFARDHDGVELINPGSVGMPFDGDTRASYALLHDDGRVEHRRVGYDAQASADAVRERFLQADWTDAVSQRIATARLGT
jgi:predicted phosphodiesterase